jgi:hypothetical protein
MLKTRPILVVSQEFEKGNAFLKNQKNPICFPKSAHADPHGSSAKHFQPKE